MKTSGLINDPQFIAEKVGLDYIGVTTIKEKKVYQFVEPQTGSSFSFYPYQIRLDYISEFIDKVRNDPRYKKGSKSTSQDYDYTRNQMFDYEIEEGGVEVLDGQQSYNTDLNLPDLQRKEKEINTLDWNSRENLQQWTSKLNLSWKEILG